MDNNVMLPDIQSKFYPKINTNLVICEHIVLNNKVNFSSSFWETRIKNRPRYDLWHYFCSFGQFLLKISKTLHKMFRNFHLCKYLEQQLPTQILLYPWFIRIELKIPHFHSVAFQLDGKSA